MYWSLFLVLCTTVYGYGDNKYHFGHCHDYESSKMPDLYHLRGTWYLYAVTPNQWVNRCNNFTILQDTHTMDYVVREEYISPIGYSSLTYNVEVIMRTNKLIFSRYIFGYIPIRTTWNVVEMVNDDYILLYRCGPFSMLAESQLWVRNDHLTLENEEMPKVMVDALKKINFTQNDYQLKRDSDCIR